MKRTQQKLLQSISLCFAIILLCRSGLAQNVVVSQATLQPPKLFSMPIDNLPNSQDQQAEVAPHSQSATQPQSNPVMSAEDKLKYGFEQAFLNPTVFIFPAISATRQQWRDESPSKNFSDELGDGLSRFAINYGTSSTKALFTSGIYPAVFKQNPRYQRSGKKGFIKRVLYAGSRVFVTNGDDGRQQFNSSRIAGAMTASSLANIWERNSPGRDRIGVGPTFRRFGFMLGIDVVKTIVLKEFGPDIKRILLRR